MTRVGIYSSILKHRNSIAENGEIHNELSRILSQTRTIVSYKKFLKTFLVYKSVLFEINVSILMDIVGNRCKYCLQWCEVRRRPRNLMRFAKA